MPPPRAPGSVQRAEKPIHAKTFVLGVSKATVQRVWSENEIKPHMSVSLSFPAIRILRRKFWDVIGLYLNPPEQAVVLCCDEKSQIQALQRSQPGLPLGKRAYPHSNPRLLSQRHRHPLCRAELLGGQSHRSHRPETHPPPVARISQANRPEIPLSQRIHIILDNYSTHKHPVVKRWLVRHPRFELHFTPPGSSWMNLVERFFRDLSPQAILPGSFGSVRQLVDAINAIPRPPQPQSQALGLES
jgi:transposase